MFTIDHWNGMVQERGSSDIGCMQGRKYVADTLQRLRETAYIRRSYKRSALIRACMTLLKVEFVPLPVPYHPDGYGCFFTRSRHWKKLRRINDTAMVVHRRMVPLLLAVHTLAHAPQKSMGYSEFSHRLLFVRRATKRFRREDVAMGVRPRSSPSAQQPAQGVERVVPYLAAVPVAEEPDAEPFTTRQPDLAEVGGEPVCPSFRIQVIPPEVAPIAVEKRHHVSGKVRHRKPKHERVQP